MLQKISVSGRFCSSELSIHQRNLKKNILSCFQHNNNNNKKKIWTANQYIRMISEGSCDTEDWSNDAENSALKSGINYMLTYIEIESRYFK